DRHERRLHRRRRLRRGPGHRGARAVQPQAPRRAARPSRRGLRRSDQAAADRSRRMTGGQRARLVLATANPKKLTELGRILAAGHVDVDLATLDRFPGAPEVAETGATFAANALLKARAIAAFTGLPAVADDSGLCVDALNGMPGVLSARWSGRHGDDEANLR